jgi:hypothetical protein
MRSPRGDGILRSDHLEAFYVVALQVKTGNRIKNITNRQI